MLRSLSDVQAEFAAALNDPATGMPGNLAGPDGAPAPRRFAVYRNNVIVGLIDSVASAFPAVKRIVGEEFFSAMARIYVVNEPPKSPVLMHYGTTFASFIARFEPAETLPYLADVALIERAWHEAYHAAEALPLGAAGLSGIAEADLPALVLALHPSVRIVCSPYPAFSIWRMNTRDEPVTPVDMAAGGEDTLIVRPEAEVEVRVLPPGGAAFVGALAEGRSLSEAAGEAIAADAGFDLPGNLAGLIDSGAVVGYSIRN